jgi:hypothetical protein
MAVGEAIRPIQQSKPPIPRRYLAVITVVSKNQFSCKAKLTKRRDFMPRQASKWYYGGQFK